MRTVLYCLVFIGVTSALGAVHTDSDNAFVILAAVSGMCFGNAAWLIGERR